MILGLMEVQVQRVSFIRHLDLVSWGFKTLITGMKWIQSLTGIFLLVLDKCSARFPSLSGVRSLLLSGFGGRGRGGARAHIPEQRPIIEPR